MLGILFAAFVLAFCVDSMVEYPFLTPKLVGTFVLVLAMADATRSVYMGETESRTRQTLRRWAGRLRKINRHEHDAISAAQKTSG